jgi:hypothetical protein
MDRLERESVFVEPFFGESEENTQTSKPPPFSRDEIRRRLDCELRAQQQCGCSLIARGLRVGDKVRSIGHTQCRDDGKRERERERILYNGLRKAVQAAGMEETRRVEEG